MSSKLSAPYLFSSIVDTVKFSIFVMSYVGVILFINFTNIGNDGSIIRQVLIVFTFSLSVGIIPIVNSIIAKEIIPQKIKDNWKVKNELYLYQIHFLTIGIANNLISIRVFPVELTIGNFILNILITYVIGSLPVGFMILRKQNISIKRQFLESNIETQKDPNKTLSFVETSGNYLELTYRSSKKERIRSTLKDFLDKNPKAEELQRTHRAYAVNLSQVIEVSGNSQGLQLSIKDLEKKIPVSRKYVETIKKLC